MLTRILDWLAGEPGELQTRLEELRPGKRGLKGRLVAAEPLRSPIKASLCAGFYYRSSYRLSSRMKGYVRRPLRDALAYADELTLELEGGTVRLEPVRCEMLTHEDHVTLTQAGFDDYQAREQTVADRATVRVFGKLRRVGEDGWSMCFYRLEVDEPERSKKRKRGKVVRPAKPR